MGRQKTEPDGYNIEVTRPLPSGEVCLSITDDDGEIVFAPDRTYKSEPLARQAALRWVAKKHPEQEPVEAAKRPAHIEAFEREVKRLTKLADEAQARAELADKAANQHRGIAKGYRSAAEALTGTIEEAEG